MKPIKFLSFAFAVLCGIFLCSGVAHATSYGLTIFDYNVEAGTVTGTSQTYLDYDLAPYYNAGVEGNLIKFRDETHQTYDVLENRINGFDAPTNNAIVVMHANVQRGETYAVISYHDIQTRYIQYGYFWDPYGLSYNNYFSNEHPSYQFQYYQTAYLYQPWVTISGTGVIVGLPNITSISPEGGLPGTTPTIQIYGKYIGEHIGVLPVVEVSGTGVTATARILYTNPNVGVEVDFEIAENADIGNHTVRIRSGYPPTPQNPNSRVPSNTLQFRVGDRSPVITEITPPQGSTGQQVAVTIRGSNFGFNPEVQIDGLGVSRQILSSTTTEIQAVFTVADSTYAGDRNVNVKSRGISGNGFTTGNGNSDTSNNVGFTVNALSVRIPDDIPVVEKNGEQNVRVIVEGLPNTTDKIKLTLKPLEGATGAAKFVDNDSNVIEEPNGTYNLKIKGITESNALNKMTIEATPTNAATILNHKEFTVAVVNSIVFENINGDDVALDPNPGNGVFGTNVGLRIFPDKKTPTDMTDRSILRVKADVSPSDPSIKVYFASYDLDDPSAVIAPIDGASDGNDNNGGDFTIATPSTYIGGKSGKFIDPQSNCTDAVLGTNSNNNISKITCTASNSIVTANFKTTMQPGDNFAILATLNSDYRATIKTHPSAGEHLINTANQIIPLSGAANPNNVQGIRTEPLTVWRKLHIEVDSMGKAHENYVRGNVSGGKVINRGRTATINVVNTDLEVNRFEKGRMEVAYIANVLDVVSNTASTVEVRNSTAGDIALTDGINFELLSVSGARSAVGTIPAGQTIASMQTVTLTISGTPLDVNVFSNGSMFITPVLRSLQINSNTNNSLEVTNNGINLAVADGVHFRLYDDDDMKDRGVLDGDENQDVPEPDTSLLADNSSNPADNVFAPAYIVPKYDIGGSHSRVPFFVNPTFPDLTALLNSSYFQNLPTEDSPDFWTVYLLGAYQPPRYSLGSTTRVRDGDPVIYGMDGIDTVYGASNSGSTEQTPTMPFTRNNIGQGAILFAEVGRPTEYPTGYGSRPVSRAYTTAHEVGHLFRGVHVDQGLMAPTATRTVGTFSDTSLAIIRATTHP